MKNKINNNNAKSFASKYESLLSFVLGKLMLSRQLDRETSSNVQFIVIATDSGTPPLSSQTAVNVIVLDSNDNSPVISGQTKFVIPENSNNHTLVAKLNATDRDIGHNANITFQLQDFPPFRINSSSVSAIS